MRLAHRGSSRRAFLCQAAGTIAAVAGMAGGEARAQPAGARPTENGRPNFIHILCDDLGYGDLGCYGHPKIQTPYLDAFANEGLRLSACYAAAPVCSPSRAGTLVGRNPYRCRIPDWIPERSPIHLQREEVTVARLLAASGYATGFSGKWHLNGAMDGSQPGPGEHGLAHWFATQNNARPSHCNPDNFVRNGKAVGPLEGYSSAFIVDEAIRFLRANAQHPFALFVWFHAPHEPIATAEEFRRPYSSVTDPTQVDYFGNVSQMDSEVGLLLIELERLRLRENTVVFFTSDNGPETLNRYPGAARSHGRPGALRGMKLHLHEGGIRVPGLVRWPGHILPGARSDEAISGVDLLPSWCAIAGVTPPRDRALDGASFVPLWEGQRLTRAKPLYWRYDRALTEAKHAIRDGEWKLLANAYLAPIALYNLAEDIAEQNDLLLRAPDRAAKLLESLRAIHGDITADPISAD